MAKREYCSSLAEELKYWSTRLHELSNKFDRVPSIDKYKILSHIEELHILMTEVDDRLCEMMTSCSSVESIKDEEVRPAT
jgi:hypothetical protein